MIVLYIIAALLLLVLAVLLLPISVSLRFDEVFVYKIKVAGFKIYPIKSKHHNKPKNSEPQNEKKQQSFFEKLKRKKGFVGTIKEIFAFLVDCFGPAKRLLKHIYFKKVKLSVTVAGEDAAKTAIDYGLVCSAVYPALSFVESLTNIEYKKVDVRSDFEAKKSGFRFALKIKTRVIFILAFGFRILKEYKKFSGRNDL